MFHFHPKNITRSTITCGIARGHSNAVHVIILDGEPARDHGARQQTKRASKLLQYYSNTFADISTNALRLTFQDTLGSVKRNDDENECDFLLNESFCPVLSIHSYVRTCLQRHLNITIFLILLWVLQVLFYDWIQRKGVQHKLYRISPCMKPGKTTST